MKVGWKDDVEAGGEKTGKEGTVFKAGDDLGTFVGNVVKDGARGDCKVETAEGEPEGETGGDFKVGVSEVDAEREKEADASGVGTLKRTVGRLLLVFGRVKVVTSVLKGVGGVDDGCDGVAVDGDGAHGKAESLSKCSASEIL